MEPPSPRPNLKNARAEIALILRLRGFTLKAIGQCFNVSACRGRQLVWEGLRRENWHRRRRGLPERTWEELARE